MFVMLIIYWCLCQANFVTTTQRCYNDFSVCKINSCLGYIVYSNILINYNKESSDDEI